VWLRKWFHFRSSNVQWGIKWNYARFSPSFGFSPVPGSRCGGSFLVARGVVAACSAIFWLVRCAGFHSSSNCALDSKDNGSGGNLKAVGPEAQTGGAFIEPLIEPHVEPYVKPRSKIGADRATQTGVCCVQRAPAHGPATRLASHA
jgi:hypothetical protein